MKNIHIIGAGGIGGWIIDIINERFSLEQKRNTTIHLYDGDIVEANNLLRQNFVITDIGMPKVEALELAYPFLNIIPYKKYIKEIPFIDIVNPNDDRRSEDIVICAIDKARERVAFSIQCITNHTIYIDVGNNVDDGQMVVEGVDDNPGLCSLYPDIIEKSYKEDFMSCAMISQSSPQILQVNFLGAELAVETLPRLYNKETVFNYEYNSLGDAMETLTHDFGKDGKYYRPRFDKLTKEQIDKIIEIYNSSVPVPKISSLDILKDVGGEW